MTDIISALPVEIICHVIYLVDSKKSLCNLSLCSKAFHGMTLPYLYGHLELYDSPGCNSIWRYTLKFPHLCQLTSLFLRKPEYASFVRHLTVRGAIYDESDSQAMKRHALLPFETVEVDDMIKAAIKASSQSQEEAEMWLEHASWKNHSDALIAIMLPLFDRLEKLDVMLIDNHPYLERTLKRISSKETPFET